MTLKNNFTKNLIPINYGGKDKEGKPFVLEEAMHSRLPETGDLLPLLIFVL